jgi:hypothetical protein
MDVGAWNFHCLRYQVLLFCEANNVRYFKLGFYTRFNASLYILQNFLEIFYNLKVLLFNIYIYINRLHVDRDPKRRTHRK